LSSVSGLEENVLFVLFTTAPFIILFLLVLVVHVQLLHIE